MVNKNYKRKKIYDTNEIDKKEIEKLKLNEYTSHFLIEKDLFKSLEKLRNFYIYCPTKEEVLWIEDSEEFQLIETINELKIYEYALMILMKLKVNHINILFIECSKEDKVSWIRSDSEEFKIEKIGKLSLIGGSSKVLIKFKESLEIEKLIISSYVQIEWIKTFFKEVKIKEIKKIHLNFYALSILKILKEEFIPKITEESFNNIDLKYLKI